MKQVLRFVAIVLFISNSYAQKSNISTKFSNYHPRSIGPAGMSGRVTSIDVHPLKKDWILIGTASGGVWISKSGGTSWKPIFDDQPTLSIGSVTFSRSNPSSIWVGTGEGNPRNSHSSGEGIYKSTDGGASWKCMGLKNTKTIHRLIVHPTDENIVYAGAMGSVWGNNKERGLYKSINGGKTWKKILYIDDETGVADLIIDPTNPNKLFVAMWQYVRKPWHFNSGGKSSGLYKTIDSGETWKKITEKEGLPKGNLGRIGLAISAANPDKVYALIEAKENGLFLSSDGGEKWHSINSKIGSRPFYYADIYADPNNENQLYNLQTSLSKSIDGGKNFDSFLPFKWNSGVHPDHHAFYIHPSDSDFLIDGNDGGLSITRDGGKNWQFIENLPLGQFYHISIDQDYPYNIYGGMQDNGSWVGPSKVLKSGDIRNSDWQELLFGDGFDVLPYSNTRYGYAMYQGGGLYKYDRETGNGIYIKPTANDSIKLRYNWSAAIAADPFNKEAIYFGSQFVHYSSNQGLTWKKISPDLTKNDTSKLHQNKSGGLTPDVTNAENYCSITAISPSSINKEVIWVGTDDGNIQQTKNGGNTWKRMNTQANFIQGAWVTQIELSQHNNSHVFVAVNDYRRNNWESYLYFSNNSGNTWVNLANSDVKGHVWAIKQDPINPSLLFLGTDRGLYVSIDFGKSWQKWTSGFPSVPVSDLKIHEGENDLIIGTFGRAAYVLDDIQPLRSYAKDTSFLPLQLLGSPSGVTAYYGSASGTRFTGEAMFRGKNEPQGAPISFWLDSVDTKKKAAITIIQGIDTLRNELLPVVKGFNRYYYSLHSNGILFPSKTKSKKPKDIPKGLWLSPGTYKLILQYGKRKDSTELIVKHDPRVELNEVNIEKTRSLMKRFEKTVAKVRLSYDALLQSKENVKRIGVLFELESTDSTSIIKKLNDSIQKEIVSILNLYTFTGKRKGIQSNEGTLFSDLYKVNQYLHDSGYQVGENALQALSATEKKANEALEKYNYFIKNSWKTYQNTINTRKYSIFNEEIKEIQVE